MQESLCDKRIFFPWFDSTNMGLILACMQASALCLLHDDHHTGGAIVARKTNGKALCLLAQLDDPEHVRRYVGGENGANPPDIIVMGRSLKRLPASWQEMDEEEHLGVMLASLDRHYGVIESCVQVMAQASRGILLDTSPVYWGYALDSTVMQGYAKATTTRLREVLSRHPGTAYRANALLPGDLPKHSNPGLIDLTKTRYYPGRFEEAVLSMMYAQAPIDNGDVIVYTAEGSLDLY